MQYLAQYFQRNHSEGGGNAAVDEWMQNFTAPTKPAVDTPLVPPAEQVIIGESGGAFRVKEKEEGQAAPEPEPIFERPEGEAAPGEEKKPKQEIPSPKDMGLKFIDALQAELVFKKIARVENGQVFRLTDEEREWIMEYIMPVISVNGSGVIDPRFIAAGVFLYVTYVRIDLAMKLRKQSIANERVARGFQAPVERTEYKPPTNAPERKSFRLHTDGRYYNDRYGNYVKKGDPGERVDLTNRKHVEEVLFLNGWEMFRAAYKLPEDWREKNGFPVE